MSYFNKIKSIATSDGMPEKLALLIAAQAAHETGNFTSEVFIENNNCFGYKRVEGAIWQEDAGRMSPEGNAYAKYATINNSVHELTAWIRRRINEGRFPAIDQITSGFQYAQALKSCGYYGDTVENYARGLHNALNRYTDH